MDNDGRFIRLGPSHQEPSVVSDGDLLAVAARAAQAEWTWIAHVTELGNESSRVVAREKRLQSSFPSDINLFAEVLPLPLLLLLLLLLMMMLLLLMMMMLLLLMMMMMMMMMLLMMMMMMMMIICISFRCHLSKPFGAQSVSALDYVPLLVVLLGSLGCFHSVRWLL